jgi:hypothetical protein
MHTFDIIPKEEEGKKDKQIMKANNNFAYSIMLRLIATNT